MNVDTVIIPDDRNQDWCTSEAVEMMIKDLVDVL